MADNKFLPILQQHLLEILEDDKCNDITIEVGKDTHVKVFRSHTVILYYRSPYFRKNLPNNKKKNGTLVNIKLPNISPEIFRIILRYIYGGELSLETYDILDIIKILEAASELSLQELITYLQDYLIKNKGSWMEQNFNLINQISIKNDALLNLQKFCTDLMSKKPEMIFESHDFVSIPEESLVSLIQNENLQMNVVQVWEHVLKWGLAQNPKLPSDPSSYSKDDFNALKNTLRQCIPIIQFNNLTSKEFLNKVFQYKKILPEELYEGLIKRFLDSDNEPSNKSRPSGVVISANMDSKIISNKHVELIVGWIDKVDTSKVSTTSYEFKLMLRGSRDGFTVKKFHEICDNQPRTVSIIKVKDSGEILGGYNPIEWKSGYDSFGVTKDSFIFSFKEKENIDDYILSRVKNEACAINYCTNCGPSFGGTDLVVLDPGYNCCSKEDYEKQIRETDDDFSVEEYEVFQIIKHEVLLL